MPRLSAASALLLCLAGPPAWAEGAGEDWIRRHLLLDEGTSWEQVEGRMRVLFLATDVNGGGVTALDHDLARRGVRARFRAGRIANWSRYDLDGDGQVTRVELTVAARNEARIAVSRATGALPTREQVAEVLEELVTDHMEPDSNADGVVSFAEILDAANRVAEQAAEREGWDDLVPLGLDADGDGTVTLDEYTRAVRSAFDGVDRDGDGLVSLTELVLSSQAPNP